MDSVRTYLEEFGYTEQNINIILNNHALCNLKESTLLEHAKNNNKFFLEKDYTPDEIKKMVKTNPSLYDYSDIMLKQKIQDIMLLGYTENDVIKMTKMHPALYSYSIENLKQKIDDLMKCGYTKEDVIDITRIHPTIYSYSIENIKQKIEDIMLLGYIKEEVIKMTKNLPTLFGLSIDNISPKIKYLNEINLGFIVLEDTKQLMQSVDLTYARYEHLKEQGRIINSENYKLLFYGNKQFSKQFGIEKKELLEKYSYKNREERRNEK